MSQRPAVSCRRAGLPGRPQLQQSPAQHARLQPPAEGRCSAAGSRQPLGLPELQQRANAGQSDAQRAWQVGRQTRGVASMKLRDGDFVVGMSVLPADVATLCTLDEGDANDADGPDDLADAAGPCVMLVTSRVRPGAAEDHAATLVLPCFPSSEDFPAPGVAATYQEAVHSPASAW